MNSETRETFIPPTKRRSGLHRDWTADGYTVRVTWTKGPGRCRNCGPVRGIWAVHAHYRPCGGKYRNQKWWDDSNTYSCKEHGADPSACPEWGGSADFCDQHRAPHSTIPDLDYTRHLWHEKPGISETEHLHPVAGQCTEWDCGDPATSHLTMRCGDDCDDLEHWHITTSHVISPFREDRTETLRIHTPHTLAEWTLCPKHRDELLRQLAA